MTLLFFHPFIPSPSTLLSIPPLTLSSHSPLSPRLLSPPIHPSSHFCPPCPFSQSPHRLLSLRPSSLLSRPYLLTCRSHGGHAAARLKDTCSICCDAEQHASPSYGNSEAAVHRLCHASCSECTPLQEYKLRNLSFSYLSFIYSLTKQSVSHSQAPPIQALPGRFEGLVCKYQICANVHKVCFSVQLHPGCREERFNSSVIHKQINGVYLNSVLRKVW